MHWVCPDFGLVVYVVKMYYNFAQRQDCSDVCSEILIISLASRGRFQSFVIF